MEIDPPGGVWFFNEDGNLILDLHCEKDEFKFFLPLEDYIIKETTWGIHTKIENNYLNIWLGDGIFLYNKSWGECFVDKPSIQYRDEEWNVLIVGYKYSIDGIQKLYSIIGERLESGRLSTFLQRNDFKICTKKRSMYIILGSY
eukprot:TRINITY_DN7128_c0_g3_i1.p1 TRINITY_DN7128_c0_g3~~TRINITY_DN7128_c0_g3_i1.p1  ORF type:complete len:144 (-),score=28.39 TRINITY_DN7128_c0_g3_i1:99-530(-)